jgi:hypothetical protein
MFKKFTVSKKVVKIVLIILSCCLVLFTIFERKETSMIRIKKSFEKKFELGYPKSAAEHFAIELAIKSRLDGVKSELEKSVPETNKFKEKILALPGITKSDISARLDGFKEHKAMEEHDKQLERDFKSMVNIAACSGYLELAKTYGYKE